MARNHSKKVQLESTEPCPCESGKKYGKCCWKKKFEWCKDAKGRIFKSFQLSPELVELLKKQQQEFKRVFGRLPRGKEPVFFDRYFHSTDDFNEQFREVATNVDLRPEILYATQKTDRIVTKENWNLLTKAEQEEWTEAIDEYFEREESGDLDQTGIPDNISRAFADLLFDLYATVCHVGAFLEKSPRSRYSDDSFLQYYFTARTLDTTRTIYRWFKERYSDDIWVLLRVIYEGALRLAYLRCNKNAPGFFFASSGMIRGTHEYAKTTKGRLDYRTIVELSTGAETKSISNREMIASTGSALDIEIYEELYPFLSSYAHIGLDAGLPYFDRSAGFLVHKDDNPFFTLQWASVVIWIWIDEISRVTHIKKQPARDLAYMRERIRLHLVALFDHSSPSKDSHLMKLVRKRLDRG